jgi:hypothetical protein
MARLRYAKEDQDEEVAALAAQSENRALSDMNGRFPAKEISRLLHVGKIGLALALSRLQSVTTAAAISMTLTLIVSS